MTDGEKLRARLRQKLPNYMLLSLSKESSVSRPKRKIALREHKTDFCSMKSS